MSKADFIRHLFTGLFLIAFVTGCYGTHSRTSTGEYTDDASISNEVRTGLLDDPAMRGFQIKVESFKGFVQLSGFVDSAQTSGRATEIANSVRGVKYVKNDIVIKKNIKE
nr:BON domain-containing protein [Desulfobulbaceae bacterium]